GNAVPRQGKAAGEGSVGSEHGKQVGQRKAPAIGAKLDNVGRKVYLAPNDKPPPKTPGGRLLSSHAATDSLKRHGFVEPYADVDAIIDGASRITTQRDGAKVYIKRAGGRQRTYSIAVVGAGNKIVTAMQGLDPVALRNLGKTYGFDPNP